MKRKSIIEKWLHQDRTFKKSVLAELFEMSRDRYEKALETPHKYFTVSDIDKIASLTDKDIVECFFAVWKRPYALVAHDLKKLELLTAIEQMGLE
jgi:hypothetical protein